MSRADVIEAVNSMGREDRASFRASNEQEFAISTLEKHVITYHVDHAVKILRIIAIE